MRPFFQSAAMKDSAGGRGLRRDVGPPVGTVFWAAPRRQPLAERASQAATTAVAAAAASAMAHAGTRSSATP